VRTGLQGVASFPTAVLLRRPFDSNYYHAMVEVLPSLVLLENWIPDDTPIIISPELAKADFFQRAVRAMPKRNWIIQQPHEWISVERLYVPQIKRCDRELIQRFVALIGLGGAGAQTDGGLIFLTRSERIGRALTNSNEVNSVVGEYGFDVIDTGTLAWEQQVTLFSNARVVAGIHGASLANVVFRNGRTLNILEIFPPHDAEAAYWLLACEYGYAYDHMVGFAATGKDRRANFAIDMIFSDKSWKRLCIARWRPHGHEASDHARGRSLERFLRTKGEVGQ
jgi:capsular polysaccharide biosynthesis protein